MQFPKSQHTHTHIHTPQGSLVYKLAASSCVHTCTHITIASTSCTVKGHNHNVNLLLHSILFSACHLFVCVRFSWACIFAAVCLANGFVRAAHNDNRVAWCECMFGFLWITRTQMKFFQTRTLCVDWACDSYTILMQFNVDGYQKFAALKTQKQMFGDNLR